MQNVIIVTLSSTAMFVLLHDIVMNTVDAFASLLQVL